MSLRKIDIFGALDSFRRQFERPSQPECDRQAHYDEQNNKTNHPVWNVEDREHLRDTLGKGPAGDHVRNRDFVNIAPLEFAEEFLRIHLSSCATGSGRRQGSREKKEATEI